MSATIGKVAYIATWDATSLSKGVLSAQAMFRQQKKITESLLTPTERYSNAVTNLENIIAKYPDLAKNKVQLMSQVERQYLTEEAALRSLTMAEQRRLDVLSEGDRSLNRQAEAEARRAKMLADSVAREKRLREVAVENRRKSGQGERNADLRRQQEEADSVRQHRDRLHQRLRDRKQYDDRMRQQMAVSLKYHEQENAGFLASGGGASGRPAGSGGLGLMGASRLLRGGAAGLAVGGAVAGANALNNGSMATANRDLERAQAAFTTFAGSLEQSNAMIAQMRLLSANTGVSFNAFRDGSKMMMMMGASAESVLPAMKNVAIVTGGNGDAMTRMARAMSQTNNMGKLMAEELNQMIDAGWSPAEEIIKRLNLSGMPEFRKQMEAGAISAQMVTDALSAAVSAGGRYDGFLENLEGTSARTFDKMSAQWEQMNADMGAALEPLSNAWTMVLQSAATDLSNVAKRVQEFNQYIGLTSAPAAVAADEGISAKEQKSQERAAKLEAERNRVAAALAEQDRARDEQKKMGLEQMAAMQLDVLRSSGAIGDDQLSKFDRYVSLLNEENQKKAVMDFAMFQNTDNILGMLDEEVQAEVRKTEEMQKQWKLQGDLVKKREDFDKLGQDVVGQFEKEMAAASGVNVELADQLAKLMALREMGNIDQEQFEFARDRAVRDGTRDQTSGMSATTSSINAGSQEAYQFLVGVQDRNLKMQLAKAQEQITLQRAMVLAIEKSNQLLDDIADNPVGVAG